MRTIVCLILATLIANGEESHWYRGNTHTHTNLCDHADTDPATVAKWYLDHGYHFVCLSEHNQFIDPASVALPKERRSDFILVPGEEITGPKHVHTTALNCDTVVAYGMGSVLAILKQQIAATRADHAVPIVNHPNWEWAISIKDMRGISECHLFELHNGGSQPYDRGDDSHPSTETMWDTLLDAGMVMYGVGSDDAHIFKKFADAETNPGRGWVMVRSASLEAKALAEAMDRGDFYSSSGVFLDRVEADAKQYLLRVDLEASRKEVAQGFVLPRPAQKDQTEGVRIDFIGPKGEVLKSIDGLEGACARDPDVAYLRARVTWTEKKVQTVVQYFAWTQPVFQDGRLQKIADDNVKRGWAAEAQR